MVGHKKWIHLLLIVGVVSLLTVGCSDPEEKDPHGPCTTDDECMEEYFCSRTSTCLEVTADTDEDGLTDQDEEGWCTDPENSDSDSDGTPDLIEIGSVNNPSNVDGDELLDACESASEDDDYDGNPNETDECNNIPDPCVCQPVEEVCDGVDNDCDDQIDEDDAGDPLTEQCGSSDEGECEFGIRTCEDGDFQDCMGAVEDENEICDGLDNDCDGDVDENFDLDRPCSIGIGVCEASGVLVCNEEADSTVCNAEIIEPTEEICNDLDDDCDGEAENGLNCCEPGTSIFCGDSEGLCESGNQTCQDDGAFGPCLNNNDEPVVVPADELCDGLDNNCNGEIDEDFDIGEVCTATLDECSETGEMLCSPDGTETLCSVGPIEAFDELCDGIDNDCDGEIDEDFEMGSQCIFGLGECLAISTIGCSEDGTTTTCLPGNTLPIQENCNGLDDDCDGDVDEDEEGDPISQSCGTDIGECAPGTITCVNGRWNQCNGAVFSIPEICDALDNDCDGDIDEDFNVGDNCTEGFGACEIRGFINCINESESACDAIAGEPVDEECNGIDDNCDGEIDNGPDDWFVWCETGALGVCSIGITTCVEAEMICVPGEEATDELCDARDNDCDGETDEDFGLESDCSVGVGICVREGTLICSEETLDSVCNVEPGEPEEEICDDGLDNDCDAQIDEGCNDNCETGASLELSVVETRIFSSTETASDDYQTGCTEEGGRDVVYNFNVPNRAGFHFSFYEVEVPFNAVLLLYEECGNEETLIACSEVAEDGGLPFLDIILEAGDYTLVVDGNSGEDFGDFILGAGFMSGDTCDSSRTIFIDGHGSFSVTGNTTDLNNDYQPGSCSRGHGKDMVFEFTVDRPYFMNIDSCDTPFDTVMYMAEECGNPDTEFECNNNLTRCDPQSGWNDLVIREGTYYVFVDGRRDDDEGEVVLNFDVLCHPEDPFLEPESCDGEDNDCDQIIDEGCNSTCETATAVNFGFDIVSETTDAESNFSSECAEEGKDVVYTFTVEEETGALFETLPVEGSFDTVLILQSACDDPETVIACDDNGSNTEGLSRIAVDLEPGTYNIIVKGANAEEFGNFRLVGGIDVPSLCTNPSRIYVTQPGSYQFVGSNEEATNDYLGGCRSVSGNDVVYMFSLNGEYNVTIDSCGSRYDTVLYVRSSCEADDELECADDDGDCGVQSVIPDLLLQEGDYYIFLDSFSGTVTGEYTLNLLVEDP